MGKCFTDLYKGSTTQPYLSITNTSSQTAQNMQTIKTAFVLSCILATIIAWPMPQDAAAPAADAAATTAAAADAAAPAADAASTEAPAADAAASSAAPAADAAAPAAETTAAAADAAAPAAETTAAPAAK